MRRSRPAALLVFALAAAVQVGGPSAATAEAGVDVVVNARAGLESVSPMAFGVNHAIWDAQLGTPEVADLLKDAGVQVMRYPGGSYSDIYHWRDHTAPGGYVAPDTDFDHFMAGVRRAGAQPMVTANYGTGSPEEAAEWVRHANLEKGYGVRYWEIGNENYGNGHYGANWEADDHADKSPAGYATLVRDYALAMKAVDPSIKIGAVLTAPGEWPDGITAEGDAGSWNQVVLSIAGPAVDFAIVHWYPGGTTAPEVLSKTNRVTDQVRLLRAQMRQYAGRELGIAMTEMNTSFGRNTQPGALFAADSYATLMANGVFNVDWWNVHNGIAETSTIGGQPDYNDFGLLSSGTCNGSVCEPALNTPFAPYHALAMLSKFAGPGDQLVAAGATDPLVKVHAARRTDGGLSVLLVNEDPDNAKTVALNYAGYAPASTARVLTYGNGDPAVTSTSGTADGVTLAPYSLTTVLLRPAQQTTSPTRPARPVASDVTDRSATISWPTPPPSATAGVKYEIHRQFGTTSEQWGETTNTSFKVTNLTPATRYTVNVLARDGAGRVSWASPPLTFETTTPLDSTCAVHFAETTDWGNGYVAAVDITNRADHPVDPWELTFTWPTTWQRVDSGWNATWSQEGTTVHVAGTSPLAAGATTQVGFVGNYQGPNVQPPAFRLNGTLCTTL